MSKGKPAQPGLLEEAPLDEYTLKKLVEIASNKSASGFDRLCEMAVELIRVEAVRELTRRGVIKKP